MQNDSHKLQIVLNSKKISNPTISVQPTCATASRTRPPTISDNPSKTVDDDLDWISAIFNRVSYDTDLEQFKIDLNKYQCSPFYQPRHHQYPKEENQTLRIFQMRERIRLIETYHCILRIKLAFVVPARPMPLRKLCEAFFYVRFEIHFSMQNQPQDLKCILRLYSPIIKMKVIFIQMAQWQVLAFLVHQSLHNQVQIWLIAR